MAYQQTAQAELALVQKRYEDDLHGLIELRLEHSEAKQRIADLEEQLAALVSKPTRKSWGSWVKR